MKPFLKKLMGIIFIIIIVAAFGVGYFFNKFNLDKWKPTKLVEQIPYDEVLEITEFEETEFYDSVNKFIKAEMIVKVRFVSHIEPIEKLPSEYKDELKKAYSNIEICVKEIPSLEVLEKMKEALADSKYLRLIEGKEIQSFFIETKINNKRVKRIEKIFMKPDSYYFVK